MKSDLLEVELDAHVDGGHDVLQLGDDVVVGGLVESRRHWSRAGDWSIHWSTSPRPHTLPRHSARHGRGGAEQVLRSVGVAAQHVVRSLTTAEQVAGGVAGSLLRCQPSETVEVVLLSLLLRFQSTGSDQVILKISYLV